MSQSTETFTKHQSFAQFIRNDIQTKDLFKSPIEEHINSVQAFYMYLIGEQDNLDYDCNDGHSIFTFESYIATCLIALGKEKPTIVRNGDRILGVSVAINKCDNDKTFYMLYFKDEEWWFGIQVRLNGTVQSDFKCSVAELKRYQSAIYNLLNEALKESGMVAE